MIIDEWNCNKKMQKKKMQTYPYDTMEGGNFKGNIMMSL